MKNALAILLVATIFVLPINSFCQDEPFIGEEISKEKSLDNTPSNSNETSTPEQKDITKNMEKNRQRNFSVSMVVFKKDETGNPVSILSGSELSSNDQYRIRIERDIINSSYDFLYVIQWNDSGFAKTLFPMEYFLGKKVNLTNLFDLERADIPSATDWLSLQKNASNEYFAVILSKEPLKELTGLLDKGYIENFILDWKVKRLPILEFNLKNTGEK